MVRAERDGDAIRSALERGDFYASNGLLLTDVRREGELSHRLTEDAIR